MKIKILITILISNLLFADFRIDSLKVELPHSYGSKRIDILLQLSNELSSQDPDMAKKYALMGLQLAKQINDTLNQANFFLELADVNHFMSNKKEDIKYAKMAMELFRILSDSLRIAKCYSVLGGYYHNYSHNAEALSNLRKSLEIFKSLNNIKGILYCYYALSAVYDNFGYYNKALEYSLKALEIYSTMDIYDDLIIAIHIQNGNIYFSLKDYQKAFKHYFKSMDLAEKHPDYFYRGVVSSCLTKLYTKTYQYDSAKKAANRALKNYRSLKYGVGIAKVLIDLGDIYKENKQLHEASDSYQKSLAISESLGHFWLQSEVLNKIAELYLDQDLYSLAYKDLQRSYEISVKISAKELILDNYLSLSKYFEKLKIYDQSLLFYKKYAELRDSLFIKSQNEIADIQISYHNEKNLREKKLLQKNNDILKLEAEKHKLQKSRFILALVIVLIVTAFILNRFHHKKRMNSLLTKKVNDALKTQREQQQIIFHQASLTSLGEQAAGIAHEVSQPLQNISFNVEIIEEENKKNCKRNRIITENVKEIFGYIDRIRQTVEHIRLFTSQQEENFSEKFSINTSIENSFRMVTKQYRKQGIKLKLNLAGNLPLVGGNPYKYEQVVLNLLSNARDAVTEQAGISHNGYNKEIMVKTYFMNREVCMEMIDNGIGISEEDRRRVFLPFFSSKSLGKGQGLGLSIVQRIVKEMGGYISFKSIHLKGTTMCVKIPVKEKIEHASNSNESEKMMIGKNYEKDFENFNR